MTAVKMCDFVQSLQKRYGHGNDGCIILGITKFIIRVILLD